MTDQICGEYALGCHRLLGHGWGGVGRWNLKKASKPASSWSVWAVALGDPHRAERPLQFLDKTIEKKVLAKIFGKTFIAEKTLWNILKKTSCIQKFCIETFRKQKLFSNVFEKNFASKNFIYKLLTKNLEKQKFCGANLNQIFLKKFWETKIIAPCVGS